MGITEVMEMKFNLYNSSLNTFKRGSFNGH